MDRKEWEKIEKDVAALELETAKVFETLNKRSFMKFDLSDFGVSKEAAAAAAKKEPQKAAEAQKAPQEAPAPEEPKPNLEEELQKLHDLVGLEEVKEDVESLINLVKIRNLRKERGLKTPDMSLHLVFMGNPGTGKTTVARILSRIYCALGVLSKGQLIEVDRSGLVAGYVGQTATKTREVIEKALGGVLFIDEAYTLSRGDSEKDFGQEAIDTILKAMEDEREDFVVIVAGYDDLMPGFISSNPGLESRFNKYFYFKDYTGEQLWEIFKGYLKRGDYEISDGGAKAMREHLDYLFENRDQNFGNARDVRNIFEKLVAVQANRVVDIENPDDRDIRLITLADIKEVLQ